MAVVAAFSSILAGCQDSAETDSGVAVTGVSTDTPGMRAKSYPVKVTCTTGMVADLAREIGGSHVAVEQLMSSDVDPHLYKASTRDVTLLQQADVIFYNGLHLEGKMGDVLLRLARRKPATFAVTEDLPEERTLEVGDGLYDPHVWFDVSLWAETIPVVEKVLSQADPNHAGEFESNARRYRGELTELHEWCRAQLATIPAERRVLITAHDAFQYFGKAYDIEVRAIQGVSTESEASLAEVNALIDFIVQRGIKAVFVETTVNHRNVEALVEGCEERGHQVKIGGSLYSDALGPPGSGAETYVKMVRKNVETIVEALQ